jgi:hypothetical protein
MPFYVVHNWVKLHCRWKILVTFSTVKETKRWVEFDLFWCVKINGTWGKRGKGHRKRVQVDVIKAKWKLQKPVLFQEHEKCIKDHEEEQTVRMSSLVWIVTSTHSSSRVTVIDANNPGDILESFHVTSSHILCISSVPGKNITLGWCYPSKTERPRSTMFSRGNISVYRGHHFYNVHLPPMCEGKTLLIIEAINTLCLE